MKTGVTFGIKNDNCNDNDELIDLWDEDDSDVGTVTQSPWQKSFNELRQNMVKLPDWNIYKKITVEGAGEPLNDRRARLTYHYNFFIEFAEDAFDSSFLRKTKMVGYSHDFQSLKGTFLALRTMRKGEEAQYVINYELMFGKMGSPPRIPPKTDILVVLQLLDIEEIGDEKAIENLDEANRTKFLFVEEKAHEVLKNANDLYKQGRYSHACRNYHSLVNSLQVCNLANEDEQSRQQAFLVKIYTQLMQCYIKMEDWKKTCSMYNELKTISPSDLGKNFQAQLNNGIALAKLGEFDKSLQHLRMAQKICPHNEVVNKELNTVNETKLKSQADDKSFWRKAFKIIENVEEKKPAVDKNRKQFKAEEKMMSADELLANKMNRSLNMHEMAE